MAEKCKICESSFESDSQMNNHLKSHKIRVIEYYQKYFPRYDLHDGTIINYKNKEQYLTSDFNNKNNFKNWLKGQTLEAQQKYCIDLLLKRKEKKNLIYTPSQVELRSILSPSIIYLQEIFQDFYKKSEELGFKNKYIYPKKLSDKIIPGSQNSVIYVDTRERKPFIFNMASEVKTLKFGDYGFSHPSYDGKLYFERKSIPDFIGTLSVGYDRFNREIEKAGEANSNLVVIVEEKITNALAFNYLPHVYKKATKVNPEFIFHNVRELIQKYPYIQFLFVDGRRESVRVIEKIFTSEENFCKYDLQLCYDLKLL